ncbi:MAG: hypothetical protein ACXWLF_08500 [Myxococcaceae bacterium]
MAARRPDPRSTAGAVPRRRLRRARRDGDRSLSDRDPAGGTLGLVATLASLHPASTVLLARVLLGERLQPVQSVGLASAAMAIVLITSR